jgi:hypothetical protein
MEADLASRVGPSRHDSSVSMFLDSVRPNVLFGTESIQRRAVLLVPNEKQRLD